MKQVERTIYQLCEEIDYLKAEVVHYKKLYEAERKENSETLDRNLQQAKEGVATALMFALSVSDDENGNLVISKENRETLAKKI